MRLLDNRWKKITAAIVAVIIVLIAAMLIYLLPYYKAVDVEFYMESSDIVKVNQIDEGYYFDGPGDECACIFYPGAKVDEKAYTPILYQLAEQGVDCFLVKMPFHMAFFGISKADSILEEYDYEEWYMMGHSLGGAMAASYLGKGDRADRFEGIIFLASYSASDLSDTELKTLSIYGSNDGVLNLDKVKTCASNVPSKGYSEKEINGGNHAFFGSYGKQKGDKEATIENKEQWDKTVEYILDFIR